MHLECKNKYFQYGPKSRLISALLYAYKNKIVYDETLPSWRVVYCVSALPGPYAGQYAYVRTASTNQIKEFVPYFDQYTVKWSVHFFPAQALRIESTPPGHSDFNETFQRVSACEYLESEKRVFLYLQSK